MDTACLTLRPNGTVARHLAKSLGCNQCYVNWREEAPLLCTLPPLRGPARWHAAARAVCQAARPLCVAVIGQCRHFSKKRLRRSWADATINQKAKKLRGDGGWKWSRQCNWNTFDEQRLMGGISKVHTGLLLLRAATPAAVSDADAEP